MKESREKMHQNRNGDSAETNIRGTGVKASRRQALKAIAAGGTVMGTFVLGSKWSRPLVETVLLPVHAQATIVCGNVLDDVNLVIQSDSQGNIVSPIRMVGYINPAASNQTIQVQLSVHRGDGTRENAGLSAVTSASGEWSVSYDFSGNNVVYIEADVTGPCGDVVHVSHEVGQA